MKSEPKDQIIRYADMFAAIGTESRLRMVVGEIQGDLGISGPNLSHHLDKLKNEGLVQARREGTFLRYSANADALRELLAFLYAECCTRSRIVKPENIVISLKRQEKS
jgi:ArsR family transcriptional regulator